MIGIRHQPQRFAETRIDLGGGFFFLRLAGNFHRRARDRFFGAFLRRRRRRIIRARFDDLTVFVQQPEFFQMRSDAARRARMCGGKSGLAFARDECGIEPPLLLFVPGEAVTRRLFRFWRFGHLADASVVDMFVDRR